MTLQEINRIILSELRRDGYLSKGTRVAIIEHAKRGDAFSFTASETDRRLLLPAVSGSGMIKTKKIAPNEILFIVNK